MHGVVEKFCMVTQSSLKISNMWAKRQDVAEKYDENMIQKTGM